MLQLKNHKDIIDIEVPYQYEPRGYQREALRAIHVDGKKRGVWVWHRRSGKDITALAGLIIPSMLKRIGAYYHYFPTGSMGRKIVWDGMDSAGIKFLDRFPPQLIAKKNDNEMKIIFLNGSLYQIVGTDKIEVVGPNPIGCFFSEYSVQAPKGWDRVRPILAENNGWAVFGYTPRGKNHGYNLYRMAKTNEDWYCNLLNVDDTHAITQEAIDSDRRSGMTEDLIKQEYYCSWELGAEGAFYAKAMNAALDEGRICELPIDPYVEVHTVWDLGFGGTAIWFFQFIRNQVRLVDYYEWHSQDISHYAKILKDKGYLYGQHWAPPDVNRKELPTGSSTFEMAKAAGIKFDILPIERNIYDGINRTMGMLPYCWFSVTRCDAGITAIEQYHKEYNEELKKYADYPLHDWSSHGADSLRYLSVLWKKMIEKPEIGLTKTEKPHRLRYGR